MEEKKKMRIADILNSNEDDDVEHNDLVPVTKKNLCSCSSVRSTLSRWISSIKRSRELISSSQRGHSSSLISEVKKEGEMRGMPKEIEGESIKELASLGSSDRDGEGGSSEVKSEEGVSDNELVASSGRCLKDASFSLGLGAGLVYLMVAAKNEFHKMEVLRSEIEVLLDNVKDGGRMKDVICKPSVSGNALGSSTTSSPPSAENDDYNHTVHNCEELSHHLVKGKVDVGCDDHFDDLEAEFEEELELLQLRLDTEDPLKRSMQQEQEMADENSAPARSHSSSLEIIDDHDSEEAGSEDHYGISPYKLERRLHELVEARQEERIKELETALAKARQELRQKEIEVSWWKDTARQFSKHVSEVTPLSR